MSDCFILTYDVTNRSSFESIKYWNESIKELNTENYLTILIGN